MYIHSGQSDAAESGTCNKVTKVGFVLLPGFSLMCFTSAIEPLRVANRLTAREIFDWKLLTRDGAPVSASNNIEFKPDLETGCEPQPFDLVVVCAGLLECCNPKDKKLLDWLRKQARKGCMIAGVSTGAEVLANSGLLDGYRCTIHWESDSSFRENHPQAKLTGGIYEIDRKRMTAAGGTASLDMMLQWISTSQGEHLASAIAEQFIHDHVRMPADIQRSAELKLVQRCSPKLAKAVKLMMDNLEDTLTSDEISAHVGVSTRQLERLFARYRKKSLHQYYLESRLQHARHLIRQTSMPLTQIAIASGFKSHSHFSRCYKKVFFRTPSNERMQLN